MVLVFINEQIYSFKVLVVYMNTKVDTKATITKLLLFIVSFDYINKCTPPSVGYHGKS